MGSGAVTEGIADTVRVQSIDDGKSYTLTFDVKVEEGGRVRVTWKARENPEGRLTDGQRVRVSGKVTDDEITSPLVIYNQSTKSFVKPPPGIPLLAKIGLILPVALLLLAVIFIFAAPTSLVTGSAYKVLAGVFVVFVGVHAAIIYRLFARGLIEWFGRIERRIPTEVTWSAGCSLGFFILAIILEFRGAEMWLPVLLLVASLVALGVYVVLFLVKSDRPRKRKRLWAVIAALCLVVVVGTLSVVHATRPAQAPTVSLKPVEVMPFPVELEYAATVVKGHESYITADEVGKVTYVSPNCEPGNSVDKDELLFKVAYVDESPRIDARAEYDKACDELSSAMYEIERYFEESGRWNPLRGVPPSTPEELYEYVEDGRGIPEDIRIRFRDAYKEFVYKKEGWRTARPIEAEKPYRSPVAGVVTDVNVSERQLITEAHVSDKKVLVEVGASGIGAVVSIAPAEIAYVAEGQPASVTVGSKRSPGKVAGVNPGGKVTISLEGDVTGLIPGRRGNAVIEGQREALAVPGVAKQKPDDNEGVFVPEDPGERRTAARFVEVTFGEETDGRIEIVKGLSEGAAVITDSEDVLNKLNDGDEVRVRVTE